MEIEYSRNLTVSHMILAQSRQLEDWEMQMIANNHLEGILFGGIVWENGNRKLWYDITGKQGLDVVFGNHGLTYIKLCNILEALCEVTERLEKILLEPQALLLLPECIFLEHATEQIYFCYYPGNETAIIKAFSGFMEYLLEKLDHGDEQAVQLAYEIYGRAMKDTFCLADLNELIHMPYEKEDIAAEEKEVCEKREVGQAETEDLDFAKARPDHTWMQMGKHEKEKRLREWKGLLKRNFSKIKLFHRGSQVGKSWLGRKLKKPKEEQFVFAPDEQEEMKSRPTVLLHTAAAPQGVLRYEGKNVNCQSLEIAACPYIIGSGGDCDGQIPSNTVSRIHARITQVEDIYFIEDLNSANGTFVGGELLNCKVRMSLQKNEKVIFADEEFRFI